jgi:hypothetical protein
MSLFPENNYFMLSMLLTPFKIDHSRYVMKYGLYAFILAGVSLLCAAPVLGQTNSPPGAFSILSPDDGAAVVVGGAEGEDPLDPDTPFIITWEAAVDPDDDEVIYHWNLSLVNACPGIGAEIEVGTATEYETTHGVVATLLTEEANMDLYDTITLYHCVSASDGAETTNSPVRSAMVTRGTITAVEDDVLPEGYALQQNYPNPFNPETTISYELGQTGPVQISVYDLWGRQVAELVNTVQTAGPHTVKFDASDLPSGVYVYRMQGEGFSTSRKLTLLR